MAKTRKLRGSSRKRTAGAKNKRGGSLLGSVVGALKTALPSIVLYEALRAQGKRAKKTMKGGKKHKKRVHKKSHKKRAHKKSHKKRVHKKSHKKRAHKKSHKKHSSRRRR